MDTTAGNRNRIVPLIFLLVFLGITALATVVVTLSAYVKDTRFTGPR